MYLSKTNKFLEVSLYPFARMSFEEDEVFTSSPVLGDRVFNELLWYLSKRELTHSTFREIFQLFKQLITH